MNTELISVLVPLVVALTALVRGEVARRQVQGYLCGKAPTCKDRTDPP